MPTLDLPDGTRLHFETSGNGAPLLLLAGFMSDGASWAPVLPLLEPHFTVIRPDNRTSGQTQPWNANCSFQIWAEDALALMDHLGHDSFHAAGHSLGGLIGWQAAYLAPNRLNTLTIAGSAPRHFERNTALFRSLIDVRRSNCDPGTWLRLLFPWLFHPDMFDNPRLIDGAVAQSLAYPHAQSADAMEHQLNALYEGNDPAPFLAAPPVPTLALLARNDLMVPLDLAAASMPDIPSQIIENAGHSMHWDQPQAVAKHIHDFIGAHA